MKVVRQIARTILLVLLYNIGMISAYRVLHYYTRNIPLIQTAHLDEVVVVLLTILISAIYIQTNKRYGIKLVKATQFKDRLLGIGYGMIFYSVLSVVMYLIPQAVYIKTDYNVHTTTENILNIQGYTKIAETHSQTLTLVFMLLMFVLQIAILPPLREELLYRGIVFNELAYASPILGMIASSVYFGASHTTLIQEIYAMFMGFMFVILNFRRRSIRPSIYAHMTINLLGTCFPVIFAIFNLSWDWKYKTAVFITGITIIMLVYKKEKSYDNSNSRKDE